MIQPPVLKADSPETTALKPVEPAAQSSAPPIHPLSAGLLVAVDNLWNVADWAVVTWWMTVPLSFLSVFVPTLWLQRQLRKDRWGVALAKALGLGLVAAIPTSLTGTPVGMALLAWTGVDRWRR
jgi:hypothetical protein